MKRALKTLLILSFALVACANADSFEDGMKAAKAQDYETALTKMEEALSADPNNLQYGSEYRQTVVKVDNIETYDRAVDFFENLTTDNPKAAANAFLNYGFAHVDRVPAVGAITQVIEANTALGHFATAVELEESWLTLYTRGNSYIFWPAIFGRAQLGVDDLEKALAMTKKGDLKSYYVRNYVGLGDGYWRLEDVAKAREIWQKGLELFPNSADLKARLALEGEALDNLLNSHYSTEKRVDTNLREIWEGDK